MLKRIVTQADQAASLHEFYGTRVFNEELLHLFGRPDLINVTLVDNAFLPGKSCLSVSIRSNDERKSPWDLVERQLNGLTAANLREYVLTIERRHPFDKICDVLDGTDGQRIFRRRYAGIQVFHAALLHRIKPLKAVPTRWNMGHVKQALANGQFRNLRCDAQYSDDFARDALNNYYAGPLEALPFLERLVTAGADSYITSSQCGWGTALDLATMTVCVNQHTFDRNSFTLVL